MSCRWLDNCAGKDTEKTERYEPLLSVKMDVLGGWSKELEVETNKIFGARSSDVLKRMQTVLYSSLNIARTLPQTLMA